MNEKIFAINLDDNREVYILSNKRCINKAMKDKRRFNIQLKYILNNFSDIIIQDYKLTKGVKYIVHLFSSSMVEGGQEYHMKDVKDLFYKSFEINKIEI